MSMNNALLNHAEEFVWMCWKFYLMSYPTCLLDLLLEVVDESATNPFDRYKDFPNSLEQHMGLGSYTTGQPAQFSKTPYLTVNIEAIPLTGCACRVVMMFDVVYSTDTPKAEDGTTRYVGSSAESVAAFRANMMSAIDEMLLYAYDENDPRVLEDTRFTQSFMERLKDQEVVNPANPNEKKLWDYNVEAFINEAGEMTSISEVSQLKREDRYTGLNVFHIIHRFDVSRVWGKGINCGC